MTLQCAELFHDLSQNPALAHRVGKLRRAPKFLIDDSHYECLECFYEDTDAAVDTIREAIAAGRRIRPPFPEFVVEWRLPALGPLTPLGHTTAVVYAAEDVPGQLAMESYIRVQRPRQKRPEWRLDPEWDIDGETHHYGIAVEKLLAMLEADLTVKERVLAANLKRNWNGSPRTKPYDYTALRAPVEYVGPVPEGTRGLGTARRMHLVRGYQWGRHTRPIEEQRWIKPFWRGDESVGVVRRDHYRVAGTGR